MSESSKTTTYPYPQQPSYVTYRIKATIESLLLGFPTEHILDIYVDALRLAQNNVHPNNPYQYMHAVHGSSKRNREIRYHDFEKIYNEVISALCDLPPLSFLAEFDAYLRHEQNDSGLDNGFLFEKFWCDTLQNAPVQKVIFVDAPTHFIEKCLSSSYLNKTDIIFSFSDSRKAAICRFITAPTSVAWSSLDELMPHNHDCNIMIWGNDLLVPTLQSILTFFQHFLLGSTHSTLYLNLPTALFDNRSTKAHFRSNLLSSYKVTQAFIIESGIAKTKPAKRSLLVLRHLDYPGHSTDLSKVSPVYRTRSTKSSEKRISLLEEQPTVTVPFTVFLSTNKTLAALYIEQQEVLCNPAKRKRPECYSFSKEIKL